MCQYHYITYGTPSTQNIGHIGKRTQTTKIRILHIHQTNNLTVTSSNMGVRPNTSSSVQNLPHLWQNSVNLWAPPYSSSSFPWHLPRTTHSKESKIETLKLQLLQAGLVRIGASFRQIHFLASTSEVLTHIFFAVSHLKSFMLNKKQKN
jgi:hypothetical protein